MSEKPHIPEFMPPAPGWVVVSSPTDSVLVEVFKSSEFQTPEARQNAEIRAQSVGEYYLERKTLDPQSKAGRRERVGAVLANNTPRHAVFGHTATSIDEISGTSLTLNKLLESRELRYGSYVPLDLTGRLLDAATPHIPLDDIDTFTTLWELPIVSQAKLEYVTDLIKGSNKSPALIVTANLDNRLGDRMVVDQKYCEASSVDAMIKALTYAEAAEMLAVTMATSSKLNDAAYEMLAGVMTTQVRVQPPNSKKPFIARSIAEKMGEPSKLVMATMLEAQEMESQGDRFIFAEGLLSLWRFRQMDPKLAKNFRINARLQRWCRYLPGPDAGHGELATYIAEELPKMVELIAVVEAGFDEEPIDSGVARVWLEFKADMQQKREQSLHNGVQDILDPIIVAMAQGYAPAFPDETNHTVVTGPAVIAAEEVSKTPKPSLSDEQNHNLMQLQAQTAALDEKYSDLLTSWHMSRSQIKGLGLYDFTRQLRIEQKNWRGMIDVESYKLTATLCRLLEFYESGGQDAIEMVLGAEAELDVALQTTVKRFEESNRSPSKKIYNTILKDILQVQSNWPTIRDLVISYWSNDAGEASAEKIEKLLGLGKANARSVEFIQAMGALTGASIAEINYNDVNFLFETTEDTDLAPAANAQEAFASLNSLEGIARQLDWVAFPPDVDIETVRNAAGDEYGRKAQKIEWDRIKTLLELTQTYGDGTLYRSKPRALGTSQIEPYYIAEFMIDGIKFAVADNPVHGNASYVLREDMAEYSATWQQVFQETRKFATLLGAEQVVHRDNSDHLSKLLTKIQGLLTVFVS